MQVKYIESEKIWRAPDLGVHYTGLGQAILAKLKESDPKRVLEVHYDSGTHLTAEDVRCQTIAVAGNLMQLGVKNGDIVVLYSMVNSRVTPITFACYTIGAAVNFFETKFEEDAIIHTLELLNPTIIIHEEEYKSLLYKSLKRIKPTNIKHILSIEKDHDILFRSRTDLESFQAPEIGDPLSVPATLMLTSGSTGFPKIIMHSHAMMYQGLYSWWELDLNSKIFCFSPLRWISQVSLMMQTVFFGVQRVYTSQPPSGAFGKDIIDGYNITHFFTVPGIYLSVLRAAEQSGASLNSLKTALIGGEVVTESLVAISAKVAPQCRLVKCYGMTELAGGIASDELINKPNVNGGELKKGLIAKIIDDDNRSLGPNEMGRVCLKSTVPYMGYWKNKDANSEGFIEGWLNTGDYGFIDEENLLNIVTRYKYLLRSGDITLIPNIVEDIVNLHPQVLRSVLVGHPNPIKPTDEVGTVFVILQENTQLQNIEDQLRKFTEGKLTKDQLQIVKHFKVIPEMPLTSAGKVDRIALKNMI